MRTHRAGELWVRLALVFTHVLTACTAYENITVVTRSHPDAFPSALRQKGKTQTKEHDSEAALLLVRPVPSLYTIERLSDHVCAHRSQKSARAVGTWKRTRRRCSSVARMKAQRSSTLCVHVVVSPLSYTLSFVVRKMQTRLACQQLSNGCYISSPCALVFTLGA